MATYIQIGSTVTVGSGGASSISFTSIPSTYTDLVVRLSLRSTVADVGDYALVQFNGDTGSNYPYKQLVAQVPNTISNGGTLTGAALVRLTGANATASVFGSNDIYIPNYAGSTAKSASADGVAETNATAGVLSLWASGWTGTSAITSISIAPSAGTFVQYSTASLYGIKKD